MLDNASTSLKLEQSYRDPIGHFFAKMHVMWRIDRENGSTGARAEREPKNKVTRNRKHRRAAAKPAACAPNAVTHREQGKEGGRVR